MPLRLSALIKRLSAYGVECETPKSGSHYKLRRAGARVFPISAHNGKRTEIDDIYVRQAAKHFGIDYDKIK